MTIRNYLGELRYLFSYYPDVAPLDFNSDMVMQYLLYLTKTLGCGRSKCCMAAQSISFFFRHVLQKPYVIPTVIYPRKVKTLPAVMSKEEILKVINTIENVKHRAMFMLLYSTGIRLSELAHLRITDIDSRNMRVKVVQGKGAKDRYTILSQQVLLELRAYYVQYRPVEYLFNGMGKGRKYSLRSIEKVVENAIIKAGLENKNYSVHTIRHSFATHLVDNGTDVHTVKELLGHNSLATTMRYLHMSTRRINSVVNPYDLLPADDPDLRNAVTTGSLLQKTC
jgi:site-specific recombinase XerD